jgi:hypothetical protein
MNCPKCGTQNSDYTQICIACGCNLGGAPASHIAPPAPTSVSSLAIVAFILGLLSLCSGGLTALPAIILGIIGLVKIEKSGGRLTGRAFAIIGIVVPVVAGVLIVAILLPALVRVRQISERLVCSTNLSGLGVAMQIYSTDYCDEFPHAGGQATVWATRISDWRANERFAAYDLQSDGTGGSASITASLYLLVKYAEVTPKSFVCRSDSGTTEFRPYEYRAGEDLIDFWDFGPEPQRHVSYSYHMPYFFDGRSRAVTSISEPGMAALADRNPWQSSPFAEAADFAAFRPTGGTRALEAGNALAHGRNGQNVLFIGGHVEFEKTPLCGVGHDNIYTSQDGSDVSRGNAPTLKSGPAGRTDSFLVSDPVD